MVSPLDGGQGQQRGNSCPFRRVLVAWDASPDSVAALRTAAALVGGTSGHVVALAVHSPAPPREAWDDDQAGVHGAPPHIREAFESARGSISGTSPVPVTLETSQGRHVAETICGFAVQHGFDLLVVGRHGRGGILHSKLGHVAQETARLSKVPVLLVSAQA